MLSIFFYSQINVFNIYDFSILEHLWIQSEQLPNDVHTVRLKNNPTPKM